MTRFPIRYKITLLVGAILILFFASVLFLTNTVIADHISSSMISDAESLTQLVGDNYNKTIKEAEYSLNAMGNASNQYHITADIYEKFLASVPVINTDVLNAFFFYEDGSYLIYPDVTLAESFDFKSRVWYTGAFKNPATHYWTVPYYDASSGTLVITVSKTVVSSPLKTHAVIGIDIQLSNLSKALNSININDHGYIMLTDDFGNIIAHKDTALNNTFLKDTDKTLIPFLQSSDKELETQKGIYIKREVALGYNLVAFVSKADIVTVTDRISTIYSLLLVVFLVIFSIFTFYSISRILAPLNSLAKTMEKSATAKQMLLSSEETNDEINLLIEGYNEMATQINEKNLEMSALYEELYASEETLKEQYDQLFESREHLVASEEKYRLIFESSSEGLWEQQNDNTLHLYTTSWYEQFDIDLDHATYELWMALIHPEDQKQFSEDVHAQADTKQTIFHSEYRIMTKSGDYMWIASLGRLIFNSDGSVKTMIGAHTNITDRKNNEDKILQLAFYDTLTGLHNKFSFENFIEEQIENNNKLALLYIDLDNFKYINDTYGHNYGDKVLEEIGNRLKSVSRKGSIISRISGDEFGIAITNFADDRDIEKHTSDILRIITNKMVIDNLEFYTTASIGISQYPKNSQSFTDLMMNADISMYKAKEANKNSFFMFNASMKDDMINKIRLENRLLKSIDHNELYLMYQPIIELKTQTIKGFESLVRWHDPEYGQIYPDQFIPIAEHNKFIKQIGCFVLSETLKTGLKLYEHFERNFEMSVNVSVVQLQDDEFLNSVKSILLSHPFPKENIIFEITESVTIESDTQVIDRLNLFKDMGIKISLDDFGTGYSSLNNLLELPLDHLKIDRSLVERSTTFDEVSAFISSITTIAHTLDIDVVTEGIENIDTLNVARNHSADYVQGYMFSKPMKEEYIKDYIENFNF